MKQIFSKEIHDLFKKHFGIKENQSDIEKEFFKKTYKYISYIKWIPGLKMIGIGNSLAMNSANSESDIDLYIVTSKNSMWLNRAIITFIFQILGVRKNHKYHAGRFCLSFFSTIDGMDFKDWKIEDDIYLYFWIVYMKPILDYDNTYENFLKINNNWLEIDEYKDIIEENKKFIQYKNNTKNGIILDKIISILDKIIKKLLLPKTLYHFEKIGKPYGVIINDDLLKFHNNDIRKEIKKEI
ncbi:MAG: hypothetical protein PHI37_05810 [Candidatus Gracilibacteria bacterium]|nr:hypothetical protein [Candidatus Gracilibacteria bacterium]